VALSEFFAEDNYTFYNHDNKGGNNGCVINQLSEQLVEQIEKRLDDKDAIIAMQKETIETLKETILQFKEVISDLKK
jgi:hypothetical protein